MPATLNLREEQKALTRRRLLGAAQDAFLTQGFVATSVESITARAGVSRQTFYQYFQNKHDALQALRDESGRRTLAALHDLERVNRPTRKDLESFVESLIQHHVDNRETYEIIMQAQSVDPEAYEGARQGREQFVAELAAYLTRVGAATKSDARVEAMLLEAQIEYFCHLWISRGWEADRKDVVRALARTWAAALRGEPAE